MSESAPQPREPQAKPSAVSRLAKAILRNVLAPICVVAILVAILKYTGLVELTGFRRVNEAAAARMRLAEIGELATQAAYYTGVATIDDSREIRIIGKQIGVPFTNTKIIYSYDGIIKAGMDFADIGLSVSEAEKKISVTLPEMRVLSNEVDSNSLKVYDEKHSAFTLIRVERFGESIGALKEEAEKNAIEKGLFLEARKNAETLLRGFLAAGFDLNTYTLEFTGAEGGEAS